MKAKGREVGNKGGRGRKKYETGKLSHYVLFCQKSNGHGMGKGMGEKNKRSSFAFERKATAFKEKKGQEEMRILPE